MTTSFDSDLDLTISRVIRGPREAVWKAWTDPWSFAQWWLPAPTLCHVVEMDVTPGGSLVTRMSEDGVTYVDHFQGCYLDIEPLQRIVLTNSLVKGWRPAENPFMTAVITLGDHPEGTDYVARVMHKSQADRDMHSDMGFYDGWGTVADQLKELVESDGLD